MAQRLAALAATEGASEDDIILHALDLLFGVNEPSTHDWARLSEPTFKELWDNDEDSIYDDWKRHYGVEAG
jgi:hypothetical protein